MYTTSQKFRGPLVFLHVDKMFETRFSKSNDSCTEQVRRVPLCCDDVVYEGSVLATLP